MLNVVKAKQTLGQPSPTAGSLIIDPPLLPIDPEPIQSMPPSDILPEPTLQTEVLSNTFSASSSVDKKALLPSNPANKKRIDTAVRNYQSNLNTQAIQRMAEQQAKEYQTRKHSPIITPPNLPAQEEREAMLRKIEVDCEDAIKRGMGFISGLMGGTIECRKSSNFQQYIDKHLEKTDGY